MSESPLLHRPGRARRRRRGDLMRALWWRRRRTRDAGSVTVTLTADTSRFETAMTEAGESIARQRYRLRVQHERSLGQAYVGTLLDKLCRDFRLDPVQTWRLPRERELMRKRDMESWRVQQLAALAVATGQPDVGRVIDGSGS